MGERGDNIVRLGAYIARTWSQSAWERRFYCGTNWAGYKKRDGEKNGSQGIYQKKGRMRVLPMSEEEAEDKFYKILNETVLPMLPESERGTNNLELNRVGKNLLGNFFAGTYARDDIPKDFEGGIIVNLDRKHEPGSHWVAMATEAGATPLLYDSFGEVGESLFPAYKMLYEDFGDYEETDDDVEQDIASSICGQLALSWLIFYKKYERENAKLI